ncbi:MAG: signal peptidase I [Lachnospiraceae bacterium]|nr:signal peptidase I [Lachnospiraceae bacterium]
MSREIDLNERRISKADVLKVAIFAVEILIIIFVVFAIMHKGLVQMKVVDENMKPTLNTNETIIINKMAYKLGKVRRNDVIVIKEQSSDRVFYSTVRVVGLPNEKVQIKKGYVYINGKKLKKKYDFPKIDDAGLAEDTVALGKKEYFVLGDNIDTALDSRDATIGNIKKDNIIGKVFIRKKPFAFVQGIDAFDKK